MFQALTRYAVFRGRSNRWEFFTFLLFAFLFWIVIGLVGVALRAGSAAAGLAFWPLSLLLHLLPPLFIVTPLMAVTIRRLHDIGLPALWSVLGAPYLMVKSADYIIPMLQSMDVLGPVGTSFRATHNSWALFAYVCGGILLAIATVPGHDAPNRSKMRTVEAGPKTHPPLRSRGRTPHGGVRFRPAQRRS